jgi:hypothetical protein
MRRVTLVTFWWFGCLVMGTALFYVGRRWDGVAPFHEAAGLLVLLGVVLALVATLGFPVLVILWLYRFFHWVTRPTAPAPPRVGYVAPPSPTATTPQYTITGKRVR